MRQRARASTSLLILAALTVACGDDEVNLSGTEPPVTATPAGTVEIAEVTAGAAFPADRCQANRAAGTINYYTGFDYAAAASIVEVVVADAKGYFDDLCLDVAITPSFSTANYPLVASNQAQFSSSGSFSELVAFAGGNQADLVALSIDGHVAIDLLMVHPDQITGLAEVAGTTIGIKGALPPAVAVMLRQEAGLVEGEDFETVLLEGFDPTAHWALPGVAGIPGWRSNEPGALERAGLEFDVYDPAEYGIPGSFGLIYTNRSFLEQHPTAVEDFMRATLKGLADAIADPAEAAAIAVERINGNGNPNFLSPEGETFRWATDAASIVDTTPAGVGVGVPVAAELEAQIATYTEVGVFGDAAPTDVSTMYDPDLVGNLYDESLQIIWPA
jgi:ABC-type nitrate/sulfonate/bicarbonate transport system substrate-binding protein